MSGDTSAFDSEVIEGCTAVASAAYKFTIFPVAAGPRPVSDGDGVCGHDLDLF